MKILNQGSIPGITKNLKNLNTFGLKSYSNKTEFLLIRIKCSYILFNDKIISIFELMQMQHESLVLTDHKDIFSNNKHITIDRILNEFTRFQICSYVFLDFSFL